jgi:hypothetical protein
LSKLAAERFGRFPVARAWLAQNMTAAWAETADAWEAATIARAQLAAERLEHKRDVLIAYFSGKGVALAPEALAKLGWTKDEALIQSWIMRAQQGEEPEQIFEG